MSDDAPDAGSPDAEHAVRGGHGPAVGRRRRRGPGLVRGRRGGARGHELALVDVPDAGHGGAGGTQACRRPVDAATGRTNARCRRADRPTATRRRTSSRARQWGARPQVCQPAVATASSARSCTTRRTRTTTRRSPRRMQQIRGDQAYHIDGRGWCDIGYNFVVDKWGNIYEGRDNSLTQPMIGVHAGGFNTGTVGVSMLGHTTTSAPPGRDGRRRSPRSSAWRLGVLRRGPRGHDELLHLRRRRTRRYPADTTVTLPRVIGPPGRRVHRVPRQRRVRGAAVRSARRRPPSATTRGSAGASPSSRRCTSTSSVATSTQRSGDLERDAGRRHGPARARRPR